MRLCNECGSAYMNTDSPSVIDRLLRAGWHEVVQETVVTAAEEEPTCETPVIRCTFRDPLKYKDLYLSWYVQCGSVPQLREVLAHLGVEFDKRAVKKELQSLLRAQIKKIKATIKGEEDVDG